MKERFEGDQNRKTLTETLMDQRIVAGNSQLAEKVADIKQLLEVKTKSSSHRTMKIVMFI